LCILCYVSLERRSNASFLLDVVSYGGQREFRAISALCWIAVLIRDWTGASIWTSQAIQAYDEKSRHIECQPGASKQRTPPIRNVCATTEGMADHQSIIFVLRELTSCCESDGDITEDRTRLKGEGGYDGDLLVGHEFGEGILRLG